MLSDWGQTWQSTLTATSLVIGSALCGASQSMNMLIGARAIQGIGGGSILSLTQLILSDIVPLEKRGVSRDRAASQSDAESSA